MSDWMTIRVELLGTAVERLDPAPGRVMLAHPEHALGDLAEAIDNAFGRWDLTPMHEFTVGDRRFVPGGDEDLDAEDSEEVTLADADLAPGSRFTYVFDLGEGWEHDCAVDEVGVEVDDEPDLPVPIFGWGTIPDQYGRDTDEDDVNADIDWETVAQALPHWDVPSPSDELAAAASRLRTQAELGLAPFDVLYAAADLRADALPADDEQLWLVVTAGTIAPVTQSSLDPADEVVWSTLEPSDWAGLIIGLVRGDVGQSAEPDVLAHVLATVAEVDTEPLLGEDRDAVVEALGTVVEWWQALGTIDNDRRLTALGRWGLPRALRHAWETPP